MLDILTFFREKLLEILREGRSALWNAVRASVFEAENFIAAVGIHRTEVQLIENTEVATDAVEGASGLQTAHNVHARIERDSVAGERLQAAAHVRTALQNGHLVTLLRQQCGREQPTNTAANNMYSFFHLLCSLFSIISSSFHLLIPPYTVLDNFF